MSIAVLERDPIHAETLRVSLESAGHRLTLFSRWTALVAAAEQAAFDAILLDCASEDPSGGQALKHVRSLVGPAMPIVVCSNRCGEMDVVDALRAGADDYLVKPLRRAELIARLEAVTRRWRTPAPVPPDRSEIGEFRIDRLQRTIHRRDIAIPLTSIDFDLSVLFLGNVEKLLTRDRIQEAVWKRAHAMGSRTLDTHVSRVRNKLNLMPLHGWRLISVYGYGYRLMQLDAAGCAIPPVAEERTTAMSVIDQPEAIA